MKKATEAGAGLFCGSRGKATNETKEIEVTPEMIEAGVEALLEWAGAR